MHAVKQKHKFQNSGQKSYVLISARNYNKTNILNWFCNSLNLKLMTITALKLMTALSKANDSIRIELAYDCRDQQHIKIDIDPARSGLKVPTY